MTYTVITSNNTVTTTPLLPTTVPQLLPGVSVGDSFSVLLNARNSGIPSQTETSGSFANGIYGGPNGLPRYAPTTPPVTLNQPSIIIYKQITDVNWVKTLGPNGNGVARNELGDWITESALSTPDTFGTGVRLEKVTNSGNITETIPTADGGTTTNVTYAAPPSLKISGNYNSAIYPYNVISYTNNNSNTILNTNSLYSLPEKIDSLVSFVPDKRANTTLYFTIQVSYTLNVNYGVWNSFLSTSEKNKLLALYTSNGYVTSGTGVDTHVITHSLTNRINGWDTVLSTIQSRVRTQAERDLLYQVQFSNKSVTFTRV